MAKHVYIKDIAEYVGSEVELRGWLYNKRSSGKLHFLQVRDGTQIIQCVMFKGNFDEETFALADRLGQESAVIVTGTIGDHGIAVMSRRKGMTFDVDVVSDVAPLGAMTAGLLERFGADVRCLKDPTRGGLAAALNEMASKSKVGVRLWEDAIPIREECDHPCL